MPRPADLRLPSRATTLVLAVIGGLVTDAAFPQRGWWPAAMVGLGLLALALRRDSARWAFVVGLTWGLSFFLVHIWWANAAVGVVPWLALSTAEAIAVGLFAATWTWIRRIPVVGRWTWLAALTFGLAWTTWEILRSAAPFGGFPWGKLAFSQTEGPLLRLAAMGGTTLVSTLVALLGFVVASAWWSLRRRHSARAVGAVLVLLAIPVASLAVPLDVRAENGSVAVGVVQGNVSEPGLGAFNNAREVIDNHVEGTLALAEDGSGDLDVVLWPENAADYDPRTDDAARTSVEEAAQAIGAPIMLGTQSYTYGEDGRADARYNDVILWQPGVGATDVYAKQHPAPFAEYIPLRDIARRFSAAVDLVSVDMAPGSEVAIVPVPIGDRIVPFGVAICFEVAYDAIVRESVAQGAEVIVVPTNNASFGVTAESEQQLAMTVFRAVEHGRAAVQVSTVGVSGVVTPNGVVTQRTGLFTADTLRADLGLRTSLTLATRLGTTPDVVVGAVTGLLALAGVLLRPGRRDRGRGSRGRAGQGRGGSTALRPTSPRSTPARARVRA